MSHEETEQRAQRGLDMVRSAVAELEAQIGRPLPREEIREIVRGIDEMWAEEDELTAWIEEHPGEDFPAECGRPGCQHWWCAEERRQGEERP